MTRYLIEGTWGGYTSSQSHICHKEVITDKKLAKWCQENYAIVFTDGTSLTLSCRELNKGERVKDQKIGYKSLIRDCAYYNVNSVDALMRQKGGPK